MPKINNPLTEPRAQIVPEPKDQKPCLNPRTKVIVSIAVGALAILGASIALFAAGFCLLPAAAVVIPVGIAAGLLTYLFMSLKCRADSKGSNIPKESKENDNFKNLSPEDQRKALSASMEKQKQALEDLRGQIPPSQNSVRNIFEENERLINQSLQNIKKWESEAPQREQQQQNNQLLMHQMLDQLNWQTQADLQQIEEFEQEVQNDFQRMDSEVSRRIQEDNAEMESLMNQMKLDKMENKSAN
jgi:flagellar biosynthesis GTPase FlhF